MENNILEDLRKLAHSSHRNLSHDPDRRGDQIIKDYSEELTEDLNSIPEAMREEYTTKYKDKLRSWLSSLSNCASAFITGPARFPTERMRKRSQWADNKYEAFRNWRKWRLEKIQKQVLQSRTPDQVNNDNWERISKSIYESAAAVMNIDQGLEQQFSRRLMVNSITRVIELQAENGNVDLYNRCVELIEKLNKQGVKPIIKPDSVVFTLREKALSVQQQKEAQAVRQNEEYEHNGIKVVHNFQEDRVQLFFRDKAHAMEYRDKGELTGWNWSPKNKAWQRKLTANGKFAAERLTGKWTPPSREEKKGPLLPSGSDSKFQGDIGPELDTKVFQTVDEANKFMSQNPEYGALGENSDGIHLAKI